MVLIFINLAEKSLSSLCKLGFESQRQESRFFLIFYLTTFNTELKGPTFFTPNYELLTPNFVLSYLFVTNTLNPIWVSFVATRRATSFVPNGPILTRWYFCVWVSTVAT